MDWSSSEGKEILAKVQKICLEVNFDAAKAALKISNLRKGEAAGDLKKALEIVLSRRRAARLGGWAEAGLFTSQSAQQASRLEAAKHHAARFRGRKLVLEIGTGAGADLSALAKEAERVISVEADPEIAQMARHNLALQGISNVEILVGRAENVLANLDLSKFDGLFSDPSRRDEKGERIKDPAMYGPPLDFLVSLPIAGPRGIKISPAVNIDALPAEFSREFVGAGDECLEQLLWAGVRMEDGSAVLVDKAEDWIRKADAMEAEILGEEEAVSGFIIEPHPLLTRTGSFGSWLYDNGGKFLAQHASLGVALSEPKPSGFFWAFKVIDSEPFDPKKISEKLKALSWTNRTEIKTRNLSDSPEEIRAKLKLPPSSGSMDPSRTLFVLRRGRRPFAILAARVLGGNL